MIFNSLIYLNIEFETTLPPEAPVFSEYSGSLYLNNATSWNNACHIVGFSAKKRVEAETLRLPRRRWSRETRPQRSPQSWSSRRAPPSSLSAGIVLKFTKNLRIRHVASRIRPQGSRSRGRRRLLRRNAQWMTITTKT